MLRQMYIVQPKDPRAMGVSKRSKTDKLKSMKVGSSTLADVLGAVMKVKPPKKKTAKGKAKPKK